MKTSPTVRAAAVGLIAWSYLTACNWSYLAGWSTDKAKDKDYEIGEADAQALRYSEAAESYAKAADRGYAPALCELGFLYSKGLGVPNDDRKASKLFRLAAVRGYAKAQFNLAVMIQEDKIGAGANGILGDDQTDQEMLLWYRKAAAQEYEPAVYNLAAILHNGPGSEQAEGEEWRDHPDRESKRWRTAYEDLSRTSANPAPIAMSPGWRDDPLSETVVDAELERCKRYVNEQGDLDSAGECFLHAYTLGIIRARYYLEEIAARYNFIGQLEAMSESMLELSSGQVVI